MLSENDRLVLKYVGERIKMFREESGYSRKKVAQLLEITPRTLAAYERGERQITMDKTEALALIFKTTVTNLTDYKNILDKVR